MSILRCAVVAASLGLAACAEEPRPAAVAAPTPTAADSYAARCAQYGYLVGSADQAACAQRLAEDVRRRAAEREEADRGAEDQSFGRAAGTVQP